MNWNSATEIMAGEDRHYHIPQHLDGVAAVDLRRLFHISRDAAQKLDQHEDKESWVAKASGRYSGR